MAQSEKPKGGARSTTDASKLKKRTQDALRKDLTKRHSTSLDEALAGAEEDGGESLLGGAPREGEAQHVDRASQESQEPKPSDSA